jgi:NADH-quinone oxidoreductase subunit N
MTPADLRALTPFLVMTGTVVLALLASTLRGERRLTGAIALAGIVATFVLLWVTAPAVPRAVTRLIVVDRYAYFYAGIILAATFLVVLLGWGYFAARPGRREEFYILALLAALGGMVLAASNHFGSFFLGLEVLSVALYGLIAYGGDDRGLEAGVKYLVLAASSAAFLLFGMALIYGVAGTMAFDRIDWNLAASGAPAERAMVLGGLALIIVGIGFKLAVVPFHLWTPDVYQGAPAPVTAFVATVSKGAVFALLLRLFFNVDLTAHPSLFVVFAVIAVASMFTGNLLALLQDNVKRMLAYSSIAHLGYLLVAFVAGRELGPLAVSFYLATYFATTLGAFGVVTVLSTGGREAERLEDYGALFWTHPWLALILSTALFSLAGIPLTAGFIGKFYILRAGAGAALWWLIILLVAANGISLYYYLRVIVTMFTRRRQAAGPPPVILPFAGGAALGLTTLLILWLGIYPQPLLGVIHAAVLQLF